MRAFATPVVILSLEFPVNVSHCSLQPFVAFCMTFSLNQSCCNIIVLLCVHQGTGHGGGARELRNLYITWDCSQDLCCEIYDLLSTWQTKLFEEGMRQSKQKIQIV